MRAFVAVRAYLQALIGTPLQPPARPLTSYARRVLTLQAFPAGPPLAEFPLCDDALCDDLAVRAGRALLQPIEELSKAEAWPWNGQTSRPNGTPTTERGFFFLRPALEALCVRDLAVCSAEAYAHVNL